MTSEICLTVLVLWEFRVRASYIGFLFVKTENNNFIIEIKHVFRDFIHSLLKISAKFVRILEQGKTIDCVSGFQWSDLEFSQSPGYEGTENMFYFLIKNL